MTDPLQAALDAARERLPAAARAALARGLGAFELLDVPAEAEDLALAGELDEPLRWSTAETEDGRRVDVRFFRDGLKASFGNDLLDRVGSEVRIAFGAVAAHLADQGELEHARALLELAAAADDRSESAFSLAMVLERLGRIEEADAALERVLALEPDFGPRPFRLSDAEFDAVVTETVAELPEEVRDALAVHGSWSREDHPPGFVDHWTLGVCSGTIEGSRSRREQPFEIVLYRRCIERAADTRAGVKEEIRITLLHEIGHALGMSEDEVRAWGLA